MESNFDVRNIASLAKIILDKDEESAIAEDLGQIVGWIEDIKAVRTDKYLPAEDPLALREDADIPFIEYEKLRENSHMRGDFFSVPEVIKKNGS